jgi:hypothetical protein
MKTIKELLQLTLKEGNLKFKKGIPNDEYYSNGYMGLCGFIVHLRTSEIITRGEFNILDEFITNNRPQPDSPHYDNFRKYDGYFWKRGLWEPRKRWLKDQIKSL